MVGQRISNRLIYLIVAVGIALRLIWIALYPMEPLEGNLSDANYYFETARNIALGQGATFHGVSTAYFPVGYSGYLSICFGLVGSCSFKVAQMANLLPSVLIMIGTYFLVKRFDIGAAKLSLCIISLSPNQIVWSGITMSEVLFTSLVLATILACVVAFSSNGVKQWLAFGWAGFSGGAATLCRTQGIMLLPFLLVLCMYALKPTKLHDRIAKAMFLVIVWASVLAPWVIRNHYVIGTWSLATNGGVNFYISAHKGATGGYHFPDHMINVADLGEAEKDKMYFLEGGRYILANPVEYVSLIPRKLLRLWGPESTLTLRFDLNNKLPHSLALFILGTSQVIHLGIIMSILYGLWKKPKLYVSPSVLAIATVAIALSVVSMVFFGGARYNYPMSPFLLILALLPWFDSHLSSPHGKHIIDPRLTSQEIYS